MLRAWRFVTILLAALSLGMSFCHVLEMPARRGWGAYLWITTTVHGGLYRMFGPEGVGPWIDGGAILAAAALALLVRRRRAVFAWALLGAGSLALANALWWMIVFPVNLELARWLTSPVPEGWAQWRDRWELGHAVVAAVKGVGFCALVLSVVLETPSDLSSARAAERSHVEGELAMKEDG